MIAAVILAAGLSSRMGRNKLLIELDDGRPMIAHVADAAIEAGLKPVIVVTGHEAENVQGVLKGCAVTCVRNARYEGGLSESLKAGLTALPESVDGALICLGDMPGVASGHMIRIVSAFAPEKSAAICVPTWRGRRGNPVLFARSFFAEMMALSGDVGARGLIKAHADQVIEVSMDDGAVLTDVDTDTDLKALRQGN